MSHYSAIGNTISCDARLSCNRLQTDKLFLRYPPPRPVFGLIVRRKFLGCRIRIAGIGPFWGAKFVAQSLQVHLLSPVKCLVCVLNLQVVAREIAWQSKPRSQQILSGNTEKNRTAHAQLVPIIFGFSYFLSWLAKICVHQPSGGPNSSPKNIFGGPKNVTKFLRDRRDSKLGKIGGPKRLFRGAREVARKMENLHLRPEDRILARDIGS